MPVADLSFEGPYGVYHSIYDNHAWVSRIGDPGFRYHAALVQLWGLVALRLASADVLPLDYDAYAREIERFVAEIEQRWMSRPLASASDSLASVKAALSDMRTAARRFAALRDAALDRNAAPDWSRLNQQLMAAERRLLDPDGLPGRPWFKSRHLRAGIHLRARAFARCGRGHKPERCGACAESQADRLASALRRLTATLDAPTN